MIRELPMRCSNCRSENPEKAKFCIECGAALQNRCTSCGFENPPQAKFCAECGTSLTGRKKGKRRNGETGKRRKGQTTNGPRLRTPNPGLWTPPHLAERILDEQAAMETRGAADGERKTITALFADIKGSTALMEDLDPEDARAIIDPALALMMEAVTRYQGS